MIQVTTEELLAIIGRQAVELELIKRQMEQLQFMLEKIKKSKDEAKNGAVPEEVEQIPT
ncbi:hypothetical protein LCGC14_2157940 [marine sediment metagenome]|uniref:Uncharacterized protein n=1 Tax=marine sediment metagenome TaxID=412755 RepID=A0A0F9GPP3_9ZZZZ